MHRNCNLARFVKRLVKQESFKGNSTVALITSEKNKENSLYVVHQQHWFLEAD